MAMQRNYFTVLFFLKKSKLLKNGLDPENVIAKQALQGL